MIDVPSVQVRRLRRLICLQALVLSVGLSVAAWLLAEWGFDGISRWFVWPASLLVSLMPSPDIGTAGNPLFEGMPLHLVAFVCGLVAQVPIYCVLIGGLLSIRSR